MFLVPRGFSANPPNLGSATVAMGYLECPTFFLTPGLLGVRGWGGGEGDFLSGYDLFVDLKLCKREFLK